MKGNILLVNVLTQSGMKTQWAKRVTMVAVVLSSFIAGPIQAADDIAISDLPKAVTQAIMKRYPKAKLISAERERDNGKMHYEVEIQQGDKRIELNVRPDGTIYKVENEDDD